MALNTSATGGFVFPGPGRYQHEFTLLTDPAYWEDIAYPPEGQELENFFQQMVAGIVGLPFELVRPLWQEEPPVLPANGTNWMHVGVIDNDLFPGFAFELEDQPPGPPPPLDAQGNPLALFYQQHERFDLLLSAYGPRADWYDGLVRDGFSLRQNNELLLLVGMGLVRIQKKFLVPELIQNRWVRRIDRRITMNRNIRRLYPILNVLSGAGTIFVS